MLSGYEETEREILTTLRLDSKNGTNASAGGNKNGHCISSTTSSLFSSPSSSTMLQHHQQQVALKNGHHHHQNHHHAHQQQNVATFSFTSRFATHKAKSRFRKAAICIIAISRIKFVFRSHLILKKLDFVNLISFNFRFLQKKHSHMLTKVDSYRNWRIDWNEV